VIFICDFLIMLGYPTTFATTGACAYTVTPISSGIEK
jgi:hypothetical protein